MRCFFCGPTFVYFVNSYLVYGKELKPTVVVLYPVFL